VVHEHPSKYWDAVNVALAYKGQKGWFLWVQKMTLAAIKNKQLYWISFLSLLKAVKSANICHGVENCTDLNFPRFL
jgi:hypothetical protein